MTQVHQFKLGDFEGLVIRDGARVVPISQEMPDAPQAELEMAMRNEGFDPEAVELGYDCLLINTGTQRVLIDTGYGQGELLTNLQAAGIEATDIDTIIITHGDGDHIGGIKAGENELSFPNARYVMTKQAWQLWTEADSRAHLIDQFLTVFRRRGASETELPGMAAAREAFGSQTLPMIEARVDRVEPETEFLPGFQLVAAPGHRTDHTAVAITSGGEQVLHVADAIRHPIQISHPEWTSTIDSFAQEAVETRRRLLEWAAANQALLFATHFTFPGLGYVQPQGSAWVWQPAT